MSAKLTSTLIVVFSLITIWQQSNLCEARYLPTRSQEDRLIKLKELLQDLLKSEDRGSLQMKEHYGSLGNGYFGPEEYSLTDEGYPVSYDSHDIDSRIARRFLRQQQIAKT